MINFHLFILPFSNIVQCTTIKFHLFILSFKRIPLHSAEMAFEDDQLFNDGTKNGQLIEDFSEQTAQLLSRVDSILTTDHGNKSSLSDCIQLIFTLEKQTRNGGDRPSTTQLLRKLAEVLFAIGDSSLLETNLLVASKKRGQFKDSTVAMVQRATELVSSISVPSESIPMLQAIRNVTEGKLYLEVERARVTKLLATVLFNEGRMKEAMELMIELPVETFSSMNKEEKIHLLLDQLKLATTNQEMMKAGIIIKKINPKVFDEYSELTALKEEFYSIKKNLDIFAGNYLETVNDCLVLAKTEGMSLERQASLVNAAIIYALLAPFDCQQQDLLLKLKEDKLIGELSSTGLEVLDLLLSKELAPLDDFLARFGSFVRGIEGVFSDEPNSPGLARWNFFCDRLIEHNLRVISEFFSQITLQRLSQLVKVPEVKVEQVLCNLIVEKIIYARINRPTKIISFQKLLKPEERLDIWSGKISEVLELIVSTGHMIAKEEMSVAPSLSPLNN